MRIKTLELKVNCRNREKSPLYFCSNLSSHKLFECGKSKNVKFSNDFSQVYIVISYQNLILKKFKLHSLNLISLIDTGNQHTIFKKSNFDKIKNDVKLDAADLQLTRLG